MGNNIAHSDYSFAMSEDNYYICMEIKPAKRPLPHKQIE